jgi:protein-disulfide isomerase
MRRPLLLFLLNLLPLSASAALPAQIAALKSYAAKALTRCADNKITLEPINRIGPAGFEPYVLTQTSSDTTCGRQTFLLHSPSTNQIVIGNIFPLPLDDIPVEKHIAEATSQAVKAPVAVTVSRAMLPDGLKPVTMTKQTTFGPFSYHGYLDASERFMIVGSRGNLYIDPGDTLLQSLRLDRAVRRGNPKAKVHIIEMSDFECPSCARAHKEVEPVIAKHLARIDYARVDLPLFEHHEWALPAALGARGIEKVAPSKYWTYVNFMFENQDAVGKSKSFDTVLQNFCEDHDIDWKRVEKIYRSPAERAALLDQVGRAFDNGVSSTPTYIINGQIMGYGASGKFTVDAIKSAIGAK